MGGSCWVQSVTLNQSVPLKCCHCQDETSSFLPPWRVHVHRFWRCCQQRLNLPRFFCVGGGGRYWTQVSHLPSACLNHETDYCFLLCLPSLHSSLFLMKKASSPVSNEDKLSSCQEWVFCVNSVFTFCSLSHLIIKLINTITARISLGLLCNNCKPHKLRNNTKQRKCLELSGVHISRESQCFPYCYGLKKKTGCKKTLSSVSKVQL